MAGSPDSGLCIRLHAQLHSIRRIWNLVSLAMEFEKEGAVQFRRIGVPNEIRTRVLTVKG